MGVHYDRALFLFERGLYEQAEGELCRGLAERPDHALTHSLIGLCRHNRDDLTGAFDWLERAIGLSPEDAYPHYVLSIIQGRLNRPYAAGNAIREAIRLDPTQASYFYQLASMQADSGSHRHALESSERGLAVDPRNAECAALRALSLARLKRHRESKAAIALAIALAPEDDYVHAADGWSRLERWHRGGARRRFREALRINPMNRWAQAGLEATSNWGPIPVVTGLALHAAVIYGIEMRRDLGRTSVFERGLARISQLTGMNSTALLIGGAWTLIFAALVLVVRRRELRAE